LENYEKFQNFHGCKLRMFIVNSLWMRVDNTTKHATGIIPDFFQLMSKKFKFIPKFQSQPRILTKLADVSFDIYRLESFNGPHLHMTTSFLEIKDLILITPGELYTSYEKLWLPFDVTTWTLLCLTFFLAFMAILVIDRLPKFIQAGIYGSDVRSPNLNVISTFFGISQTKIPQTTLARFVLILFIFFCLIFRTCYQSKLFEFMTSEPRRPSPSSVEDLRNMDYIFYIKDDDNYKLFHDMVIIDIKKW